MPHRRSPLPVMTIARPVAGPSSEDSSILVPLRQWAHSAFPNRLPFYRDEVVEFDETHPHLAKEAEFYFDQEHFARPTACDRGFC